MNQLTKKFLQTSILLNTEKIRFNYWIIISIEFIALDDYWSQKQNWNLVTPTETRKNNDNEHLNNCEKIKHAGSLLNYMLIAEIVATKFHAKNWNCEK